MCVPRAQQANLHTSTRPVITAHASQGHSAPFTYANGTATIAGSSNGGNNLALTGSDTFVIELVSF